MTKHNQKDELDADILDQFEIEKDMFTSIRRVEFMLVIKTSLGYADILANLIDGKDDERVLGTIAGADTLMVTCADAESAAAIEDELKKYL